MSGILGCSRQAAYTATPQACVELHAEIANLYYQILCARSELGAGPKDRAVNQIDAECKASELLARYLQYVGKGDRK